MNSKSELIVSLKYNGPLNKMECYKGNCEKYRGDINYILKVYREISTTLNKENCNSHDFLFLYRHFLLR